MWVHCVQPSCPSPLTQHCLAKRNSWSIWMLKLRHFCVNHACWRLRSARISSIRLFVQDPMKTCRLTKWLLFGSKKLARSLQSRSFHFMQGCCQHLLNGNILHLGARFQTWKSHSLVWTVSVWPFPRCTSHCFPSPVAFLAFTKSICPMHTWNPGFGFREDRAHVLKGSHHAGPAWLLGLPVDQMFRPLYLTLPCREPLDLVSSGHFKIGRMTFWWFKHSCNGSVNSQPACLSAFGCPLGLIGCLYPRITSGQIWKDQRSHVTVLTWLGSGTVPVIGTVSSGLVPQVTSLEVEFPGISHWNAKWWHFATSVRLIWTGFRGIIQQGVDNLYISTVRAQT